MNQLLKRIQTLTEQDKLSNDEVLELINKQIQYIQTLNLGSVRIGFGESEIDGLRNGYVYEWTFSGITFCLFNSEYDFSGGDQNRMSQIENIKKVAIETGSFVEGHLDYDELINISNVYNIIISGRKPTYIYVDFSEEDLEDLRSGLSFDWKFSGVDIYLYNEDLEEDNDDDEDDEDNE